MAAPEPLLSVITPAYNEEPYLRALYDSLAGQTDGRWELLLVDDGSTDGTAGIMRELERLDSRVRVLSTGVKHGKVAAFNLAFSEARGTHICHIGGDDLATPNSVELRLGSFAAGAHMVSFGKFKTMDAQGTITGGPFPRGSAGSRTAAGTTLSRSLADILFPIPTELPAEDIWLGYGAGAVIEDPVHINGVIHLYRMHGGNSNPRNRPFAEMTEKIHSRSRAILLLLEQDRFDLPDASRGDLERQWRAAQLRYAGDVRGLLLARDLPLIERLANASMAHPLLWRIRQSFPQLLTGWRGR